AEGAPSGRDDSLFLGNVLDFSRDGFEYHRTKKRGAAIQTRGRNDCPLRASRWQTRYDPRKAGTILPTYRYFPADIQVSTLWYYGPHQLSGMRPRGLRPGQNVPALRGAAHEIAGRR